MAALGFAFLLCMTMSVTIGSESVASNQEKMRQLEDRISYLETSIPQTLQAENEQLLINMLDEMVIKLEDYAKTNNVSEMGYALRKELQTLLSNHSLRVEQLEDDVEQMSQNLKHQTVLIERLSQQLGGVQNSCFGEPPYPQYGRPVDFERKNGSEVRYRCDLNFVQTGNSTVRCHFGKWEGRPPLCIRPATSTVSLRAHLDRNIWRVTHFSCSDEENDQPVHFSRLLDTGTGWALPTDARTFTRDGVAVLDLSSVPDEDKRGVFQCGHVNRTGITFMIHRLGWFVLPQVASVGDTVNLGYEYLSDSPSLRWLHDGQPVPAWDGRGKVEVAGVGKKDAGVYELYTERDRRNFQRFFRLVVRGCPAGFFGQRCEESCPPCRNGGQCHEELGTCLCPKGFAGQRCDEASEACDGGDCLSQIFCEPDPLGCSCAAGYRGYACQYRCDEGKFGADCKQTCHCKEGSCDSYTGACPGGCSEGWTGASCQIPAGE